MQCGQHFADREEELGDHFGCVTPEEAFSKSSVISGGFGFATTESNYQL